MRQDFFFFGKNVKADLFSPRSRTATLSAPRTEVQRAMIRLGNQRQAHICVRRRETAFSSEKKLRQYFFLEKKCKMCER